MNRVCSHIDVPAFITLGVGTLLIFTFAKIGGTPPFHTYLPSSSVGRGQSILTGIAFHGVTILAFLALPCILAMLAKRRPLLWVLAQYTLFYVCQAAVDAFQHVSPERHFILQATDGVLQTAGGAYVISACMGMLIRLLVRHRAKSASFISA